MQLCAQHVVCMTYMEKGFNEWKHIYFLRAQKYGRNAALFWNSVKQCLDSLLTTTVNMLTHRGLGEKKEKIHLSFPIWEES